MEWAYATYFPSPATRSCSAGLGHQGASWCSGTAKEPWVSAPGLAGLGRWRLLPSEIYQNKKGSQWALPISCLVQGLMWLFIIQGERNIFVSSQAEEVFLQGGVSAALSSGSRMTYAPPCTFPRGKWRLAVINTPGSLQGSFFLLLKQRGVCVCLLFGWDQGQPREWDGWTSRGGGKPRPAQTSCAAQLPSLKFCHGKLKKFIQCSSLLLLCSKI